MDLTNEAVHVIRIHLLAMADEVAAVRETWNDPVQRQRHLDRYLQHRSEVERLMPVPE